MNIDILDLILVFLPIEIHRLVLYPLKTRYLKERFINTSLRDKIRYLYYIVGKIPLKRADHIGAENIPLERVNQTIINKLLFEAVNNQNFDKFHYICKEAREQKFKIKSKYVKQMMEYSRDEYELEILYSFLDAKLSINMINRVSANDTILKWAFRTNKVHGLEIPLLSLDGKTSSVIKALLEEVPINNINFRYKYVIDECKDAAMLEFLFQKLYYFNYTEKAIAEAIGNDNYSILNWWTEKAEEGSVKLLLPSIAACPKTISQRVRNWCTDRGIILIEN